jgi:hypothetical protein
MPDFVFLFRGGEADRRSPEEMQRIVERYIAWVRELRAQGKFKAGDELRAEGRIVTRQGGQITDGPFIETKEAVGGYFLIEAADYAEAVAIARRSPNLDNGGAVEVRQISDYQ